MSSTPALPAAMLSATRADWEAAVAKALKGGDVSQLRSTTRDGIVLEPLVQGSVAPVGTGWRAGGAWQVVTRIDHTDAEAANAQILDDLAGGADGVTLVFAASPFARGFGLPADVNLAALLDGVLLDLITLRVDAGADTPAETERLVAFAGRDRRIRPAVDGYATALAGPASDLPAGSGSTECDGRVIHDAGGTSAQELAYVLAVAVAHLRAGIAPGSIGFTLTADQDQFGTIAKFRALRLLWALVQEEAGMTPLPARIHGETAWAMLSAVDVHTNILRGAVAGFAAGVGGADSLTVLPFTDALGLADGQARRIARNTQRILMDEANLHRVIDPVAGAGTIEAETHALAETAWRQFQTIEAEGGIAAALRAGSLQQRVRDAATAEEAAVASRARLLTGVTAYANAQDVLPPVLAPRVETQPPARAHGVAPLRARRLPAAFEPSAASTEGV